MSHILMSSYSRFFDVTTSTEFKAILDRSSGCWIAHAEVDDEKADAFKSRAAFNVLTDDEFTAFTAVPVKDEPTTPETGDPLTDTGTDEKEKAAAGGDPLDGPPAPPSKDGSKLKDEKKGNSNG